MIGRRKQIVQFLDQISLYSNVFIHEVNYCTALEIIVLCVTSVNACGAQLSSTVHVGSRVAICPHNNAYN